MQLQKHGFSFSVTLSPSSPPPSFLPSSVPRLFSLPSSPEKGRERERGNGREKRTRRRQERGQRDAAEGGDQFLLVVVGEPRPDEAVQMARQQPSRSTLYPFRDRFTVHFRPNDCVLFVWMKMREEEKKKKGKRNEMKPSISLVYLGGNNSEDEWTINTYVSNANNESIFSLLIPSE